MTVSFKEMKALQNSSHPPENSILFFLLLISSHTNPSFSEINHVKKRTKRGVELTRERGMGAINRWNICSGLIFVRITPPWKKLFLFFFSFLSRNAKHVRIISKERRVRKFVEFARASSNSFHLVRFIDLGGNDLCYSSSPSFVRSRAVFHRPSSLEEMKIRPLARGKSILIHHIFLHFYLSFFRGEWVSWYLRSGIISVEFRWIFS